MAKIPFDPTTQVVRAETGGQVGLNFNTSKQIAARGTFQAAQGLSTQMGKTAVAFAKKKKDAEMQTDSLNYRAKKLEIDKKAELAASATSNTDDIKKIYSEASRELDKWVAGGDDNGNPNIRWKDQTHLIKGDAQIYAKQLEAQGLAQEQKLDRQITAARNKNSYDVAITAMSPDGARQATQNMLDGGFITQDAKALLDEQADAEITASVASLKRAENKKINDANLDMAITLGDEDKAYSVTETMVEQGQISSEMKSIMDAESKYDIEKIFVGDIVNGMLEAEKENDEAAYVSGVNQLVERGSITPSEGQRKISDFGTKQEFSFLNTLVTKDYEKFKKVYKPGNLSEFQQGQIAMKAAEVEQKIEIKKAGDQNRAFIDLQDKYANNLLTTGQVTLAQEEKGNAYGVEYDLVSKERANVMHAMLAGQQTAEEDSQLYERLQMSIAETVSGNFHMDDVDRLMSRMVRTSKSGVVTPLFSVTTTQNLLEELNTAFGLSENIDAGKKGWQTSPLTPEAKAAFSDVTDTFSVMTENADRKQDIGVGVSAISGMYKELFTMINDGKTGDEILEWKEKRMEPFKRQNAIDEATQAAGGALMTDEEQQAVLESTEVGGSVVGADGQTYIKQGDGTWLPEQ